MVVAVVWLLIAQPWRGAAEPISTPSTTASTPRATPDDSASPSAATDEPTPDDDATDGDADADAATLPTCTAGDVTVEAVTDQATYAADQNPQFSITLTSTSDEDCQMNVGTATQSFIVTSGSETYWRSTDCQTEPSDQIVTISAGQTVTSASPVTWDRTRSSVDTCDDENRSAAPAGGASYHLAVAIGDISSGNTAQFLLY